MSHDHVHGGVQFDHNENVDHPGNANLGVWLSLISLTFMTATFVGTNVYLRAWSPSKFHGLSDHLLSTLPYYAILLDIVSVILLFIGTFFFRRNRWKAFNGILAVTTLTFLAATIIDFRLMIWFSGVSPQVATIYTPTAVIEFAVSAVCVVLLVVAGWYSSFASKQKINKFFPVAMNVWLYTAFSGLVIFLIEDVVTVGQFAAWCGQHLVP